MVSSYSPSDTLSARDFRHPKTAFDAIYRRQSIVRVWFPFYMHAFICAYDPFPAWVVLTTNGINNSVRFLDVSSTGTKVRDMEDTIYRCILSDLWHRMIWDTSRYIMRRHTGSPRNSRQRNPQPRCGLLFVLALCLRPLLGLCFFRPAFFVVLVLSISRTPSRTDRITTKQKRNNSDLRWRIFV